MSMYETYSLDDECTIRNEDVIITSGGTGGSVTLRAESPTDPISDLSNKFVTEMFKISN